jgi:hypothetical protein
MAYWPQGLPMTSRTGVADSTGVWFPHVRERSRAPERRDGAPPLDRRDAGVMLVATLASGSVSRRGPGGWGCGATGRVPPMSGAK